MLNANAPKDSVPPLTLNYQYIELYSTVKGLNSAWFPCDYRGLIPHNVNQMCRLKDFLDRAPKVN